MVRLWILLTVPYSWLTLYHTGSSSMGFEMYARLPKHKLPHISSSDTVKLVAAMHTHVRVFRRKSMLGWWIP